MSVDITPHPAAERVLTAPAVEFLVDLHRRFDQRRRELLEARAERVSGRMKVEDRVRQPWGLVHGGAYAAFAESLSGRVTNDVVRPNGMVAVGMSNLTTFVRPIMRGTVHASGVARHRGRTTWVWELEFTDDEGELCALSRVTIAVRPAPDLNT
ncbi:MAG: hotdog fold thioesterase [Acidimicrobiales bacterium]